MSQGKLLYYGKLDIVELRTSVLCENRGHLDFSLQLDLNLLGLLNINILATDAKASFLHNGLQYQNMPHVKYSTCCSTIQVFKTAELKLILGC